MAIMQGYKGDIITTAPTIKLASLVLSDSAFIQNRETERYNKTKTGKKNPIYPLYSQRHVEETMDRFKGYDYDKQIKINEHITIILKPAGHLLGACMPLIEIRDGEDVKRILFTGDTSSSKDLIFTKKPNIKDLKVDTIISEGTYGNKLQSRNNAKQKLKKYIEETCIEKNGQILIPVFSVGRSSSMVKYLYDLYQEHPEYNDIPIYFASPMACKAHKIYGDEDSFNFYDKKYQKDKDIFRWDKIEFIDEYKRVESELLNNKRKIILASSGMISGGYSVACATSVLPHDNCTILFVEYQGLGCAGRTILDSKYGQVINIDSKNVKRKCNVDFISMSSHADYKKIIEMFKTTRHTKIKNIILTHGDREVLSEFKEHLSKEFNADITVAQYDKIIKLE